MREIWLRTNRRALVALSIVIGLLVGLPGLLLALLAGPTVIGTLGWGMLAAGCAATLVLLWRSRRPRLAYRDGHLLVYLRLGAPLRVPIAAVEGFLLGHGPAHLPGKAARLDASQLVIRLSERSPEWERVDVFRPLGSWCNHYVTIRGTWCEPLSVERVNRLNARLDEVSRAARAEKQPA